MALVLYFVVMCLVSVATFWILGSVYGLLRSPAIYFPLSLATKMAITAVFGAILFMVGGVILSTLVFNAAMKQRPDYQKAPTLLAGVAISITSSIIIYYLVFILAWKIFD